ncbi:glycosyltransferase family 2 protein [Tuanshanicoccus lijuaniae]|uniref:glycosyltransferase family 2 protein n=1 Tax=Aerococcaceae bacterium zg-1292 TaxID=2774330 RepID=UPI001BD858E6|nr:glycosyltransferase family 2 protein [Aerococcaceae bacterium zg-A91]MBS4458559.1 glycosyltransferase family 2 protein [Aerococcaceae bacterium zg-BR33]
MKLLSIVVPSYNSQDYLANAIESVTVLNDDRIELLVVNDGSSDNTLGVAQNYETRYPNIVKAIHQENKGHGGAVNTGLAKATGKYFKVLDSDDWLNQSALEQILWHLQKLENNQELVDVFFTNYVYEQEGEEVKKIVQYRSIFPQGKIFGWDETRAFPTGKYIMMHAIIYRTEALKAMAFSLPEHTFYVDNLFVYQPLTQLDKMYYLDVDFYRYFIGRDDQSINEKVMMKRIDQQLTVNRLLIDACDFQQDLHPNQKRYLLKHLEIVTNISSALLNRMGDAEAIEKRHQLWQYLEVNNPFAYKYIKKGLFGKMTTRNTRPAIWVVNQVYKALRRVGGY